MTTLLSQAVHLPGGQTIPYVEHGAPDGIPLILLHGLTDSHRSYEPVLEQLPDGIRAYAITQRGHGDASKPAAGYSGADYAGDVIAFMDALGIEKAVIGGHSMGCWVARRVATEYPDRTLGLVLAGCFAVPAHHLRPLLDEFDGLSEPVGEEYAREWQESTLARAVPEAFMQIVIEETVKAPLRVWAAALGAMIDETPEPPGSITAPTLLAWGEKDGMVPRPDQDAMLAAIPSARLIVYEGGGHALHWERPERYAADLAAFAADC